jgi:RNA polymerase sigma-70 factor (ECF subfamily)
MDTNELIIKLYEKYHMYMLNYAKQYVNETDAEDIVHNVFLQLMESPYWLFQCILKSVFSDEPKSVLTSFLHNACCNYCRRLNNRNKIFSDISFYENVEVFEIPTDTEQEYQHGKLLLIERLIGKLSPRSRNIFVKYYIESYSIKELSEQTGLSFRTIESYLYRAKKFIRENLINDKTES